MFLAPDAGACGNLQRARAEEVGDVLHDVDLRIDLAAVMHRDHRYIIIDRDPRHVGVALETPDIVDDGCAIVDGETGDARLHGVDRDRRAEIDHGFQDGTKPVQLLVVFADRLLPAIGPCRFRADIDHVRALGDHLVGTGDRAVGLVEPAAVGK